MLPAPFHLIPVSATRLHNLEIDELVFRQDDKTRGVFFVQEGSVDLRRFTHTGQTVTIYRAKAGSLFAEASLFSPTYHCDAVATLQSQVVELDRTTVLNMFQKDSEFAIALVKLFTLQIQSYRRKLELLAIKNAQERVFSAISEGLLVGSVMAFASEILLTHEVVYRSLAKLVEKGALVKSGRGKYRVNTAAKRLT